jgi:putative addiction module killer protein
LKFRKGAAFRVYYGQIGKEIILLIVGGDKRTQSKDIRKAKELFSRYKREDLKDEKH